MGGPLALHDGANAPSRDLAAEDGGYFVTVRVTDPRTGKRYHHARAVRGANVTIRDGIRVQDQLSTAPLSTCRRFPPPSVYAVVSDGERFVVLRATPALRALQGQSVAVARDAKGRLIVELRLRRGDPGDESRDHSRHPRGRYLDPMRHATRFPRSQFNPR